jgi:hypothetical protein
MEKRFHKGEYVKYSSNGVCRVEDIKTTDINPRDRRLLTTY